MKNSGSCLKVYLALFVLIVLVAAFPYKEGFDGDFWLDVSSWFTKKEKKKESDSDDTNLKNKKDTYDDTYGSGLLGTKYTTTKTTNDSSNNIVTDEHKWLDTSNWGTYTKTD